MGELRSFLHEYKIDVALIQETQLMEGRTSPPIQGYVLYPGPRKGAASAGGGLLTYIKNDIAYRKNGHSQRGIIEILSISIPQTGTKWLTLNNIYIPPKKGDTDLSQLSHMPVCMQAISTPTPSYGTPINQKTEVGEIRS